MKRKQQSVIDYLVEENRILMEQFDATGKKLNLDNKQRRSLAKKGKRLEWSMLPSMHPWFTKGMIFRISYLVTSGLACEDTKFEKRRKGSHYRRRSPTIYFFSLPA